ncbi:MAG: hypothetical protein ABI565_09810 [Vicinamibacteria bacterium]
MKKVSSRRTDELRPEYDFASMKGGVRGKYARRVGVGMNLALLDPEVARAFPTDVAVNKALRTLLDLPKTSGHARRAGEQRVAPDKGRGGAAAASR